MIGHGRRIRLQWADDLKVHGVGAREEGIGLFPGAIIGLRGRNGGGTYFSAQEILSVCFVSERNQQCTSQAEMLVFFFVSLGGLNHYASQLYLERCQWLTPQLPRQRHYYRICPTRPHLSLWLLLVDLLHGMPIWIFSHLRHLSIT
jgi:hypothetical protein